MDKDKRDYIRVKNEFNVRISRETRSEIEEIEVDAGKSIDVSASGLLINVKKAIDMGSNLKVTFLKPNSFDFFAGSGSVVRCQRNDDESFSLGINFIDLSSTDKKKLNYYLTLCEG